jgi:geranylgeranyl pyrophosphate synthase
MKEKRAERVQAFIKSIFHRSEVYSNIVIILDRAFSSRRDGITPFLLLPILCSRAAGGGENQAIVVAAAWFLLYLAAKVFDDIEDGDFNFAPWSIIGEPQAINAATGLIFASQLALTHLTKMGVREELVLLLIEDFNRTTLKMCSGQKADLEGGELTFERYFKVIGEKSGEFFSLACRARALLGTDEVAPFSDFGYNLGVIIQIMDDFEGVWNPNGRSDLEAGRRTLPVIYALSVAPPSLRIQLVELLKEAEIDPKAEDGARRIITELGAPQYMMIEAQIRRMRAEEALRSVGGDFQAHRKLIELLDLVMPITGGIS